jgi:hypothetical protein
MEIVKEKHRQGNETSDLIGGPDRNLLRFLVKKARDLQLLSRKEIRRGSIAPQRLDNAKRSGNYDLTADSNLAEASDEETQQKHNSAMEKANQTASANGISTQLDVHLFDRLEEARREAASDQTGNAGLLKQKIRSQVTGKKGNINVTSSHGLDLTKMRDQLTAPSFSFDWDDGNAKDEEEDGDAAGILEVDIPDKDKGSESRRHQWREQMKRSVSFSQAGNLAKVDRAVSSASINSSTSRDSFADVEPASADTSSSQRQNKSVAVDTNSKATKQNADIVERSLAFDEDDSQLATAKSTAENQVASETFEIDHVTTPIDVIPRPDVDGTDEKTCLQPEESIIETATECSELQNQAEKECSEYAIDTAATQAMPEDSGAPCGDNLIEEVAEHIKDVETALTRDYLDEISPTLPFKADFRAEDDLEICPTLPFQTAVDHAVVDQSSSQVLEISPTLRFDVKLGSPILESLETRVTETDQIAGGENTLRKEDPPAGRARGSKRDASELSEASGSWDEGLDENAIGDTQDDAKDAERARRELEWVRHKRRSLRQEMGKQKNQVSQAKKTARKTQRAAALGTATMTGEDRHRYAAVVADSSTASTLAQLKEHDADDDLIASQRRSTTTRRPTFFATGSVGTTSV